MIVTLEETRQFLRVDGSEDDALIASLIDAAEEYLFNATGIVFDGARQLAKVLCWVLIADWYENRELIGETSDKTRPIVVSMLTQLKHCYQPEVVE